MAEFFRDLGKRSREPRSGEASAVYRSRVRSPSEDGGPLFVTTHDRDRANSIGSASSQKDRFSLGGTGFSFGSSGQMQARDDSDIFRESKNAVVAGREGSLSSIFGRDGSLSSFLVRDRSNSNGSVAGAGVSFFEKLSTSSLRERLSGSLEAFERRMSGFSDKSDKATMSSAAMAGTSPGIVLREGGFSFERNFERGNFRHNSETLPFSDEAADYCPMDCRDMVFTMEDGQAAKEVDCVNDAFRQLGLPTTTSSNGPQYGSIPDYSGLGRSPNDLGMGRSPGDGLSMSMGRSPGDNMSSMMGRSPDTFSMGQSGQSPPITAPRVIPFNEGGGFAPDRLYAAAASLAAAAASRLTPPITIPSAHPSPPVVGNLSTIPQGTPVAEGPCVCPACIPPGAETKGLRKCTKGHKFEWLRLCARHPMQHVCSHVNKCATCRSARGYCVLESIHIRASDPPRRPAPKLEEAVQDGKLTVWVDRAAEAQLESKRTGIGARRPYQSNVVRVTGFSASVELQADVVVSVAGELHAVRQVWCNDRMQPPLAVEATCRTAIDVRLIMNPAEYRSLQPVPLDPKKKRPKGIGWATVLFFVQTQGQPLTPLWLWSDVPVVSDKFSKSEDKKKPRKPPVGALDKLAFSFGLGASSAGSMSPQS